MKKSLIVTGLVACVLSSTSAIAQTVTFDGNLPAANPNSCIAYNTDTAQAAGHPNVLTRTTNPAAIAANRVAACGAAGPTVTALNALGGIRYSCDEYPFASSNQGGAGAQVMILPLAQNNSQGVILSN